MFLSILDVQLTYLKQNVMKYRFLLVAALLMVGIGFNVQAQKTDLKKETIETKASTTPNAEVAALKRPANDKSKPAAAPKKAMGEVYGSDYSDVVIDNWTGYYIDIYVNGNFRGTIAPYDEKVTWAIPGSNTLYGKATFRDGTYYYWGPKSTVTGYSYTWKLNP
jgi:hypothetical protein